MMRFGCNGIGWGLGGPGIIGLVLWIAVLAALVVGTIWLVRHLGRRTNEISAGETALNAAKRRLAAGEITVGEYDEIVHRLQAQIEQAR